GERAKRERIKIMQTLRRAGFKVETDYAERKMKGQLKAADRLNARCALILGEEELAEGKILLKDLKTGEQEKVPLLEVVEACKKSLGTSRRLGYFDPPVSEG
ncbi:MAG: histidine--tRNA ligase, partial [Thermicanus sp.]|nr:histidine--tRNA ligase [Thermicanus sp.]